MRILGDRIFVRITNENRESIFSKEIIRDDGSKVRLFINTPAMDEMDERRSRLFIQTGIVEAIGEKVEGIQVGDIAIIDFLLCNMDQNIVYKDDDGTVYWLNASTKYHDKDIWAYANRKPIYNGKSKDQRAAQKGDYEELSMLLGLIRNDELIARDPFIFLNHQEQLIQRVSLMGIHYEEKIAIAERQILAVSEASSNRCGIYKGDTIRARDGDIFNIDYQGKTIQCVNDIDCLAAVHPESV